MKKYLGILVLLVILIATIGASAADEKTTEAMKEFDNVIASIKRLPDAIDGDICSGDWTSYRSHMTELAQKIIEANTIIKDVQLYFPIDLWTIYNRISANPVCGIGKKAMDAFGVADVSRYSNEERMGINQNDDLCYCWSIITGREELTGFYKDGACRCTYGINNLNPNIGINGD